MNKLKSQLTIFLAAILCAYTVDGLSQNENPASVKEVIIIKKSIDENGNESVEKSVFKGDEISDEELEKMMESEIGSEVDVNVWKTDEGESIEISIDDSEHMMFVEGDELEEYLKAKGIDIDDIQEMNVNVDKESVNGKEVSRKTITVVDKKGEKHEFVVEGGGKMGVMENYMMQSQIKIKSDHKPKLGIMIAENDEGVLVDDVIENSPAAIAGFQKGDIITAVGESHITSIQDLLTALENSGDKAIINYRRDGKLTNTIVEFIDFEYEGAVKEKVRKKVIFKKEER